MRLRRVELVCGLLGGVLGFAALVVALYAPTDLICSSTGTTHPRGGCVGVSLVQQTGLAGQALPIAVFGGVSLGILVCTLWHVRSRSPLALALVWACTAALVVATVLTSGSASKPGAVFIPAAVLTLVASIAGTLSTPGCSGATA